MKMIKIILYFLVPFHCYSQSSDSIKNDKWINFNRKRGIGEAGIADWTDKIYITSNGDTLVRSLARSMNAHEVLYESSYFHNQKNGLEIAYYPNGIIKEIDYYLNGRLWETISRADTNGKLLDPGSLHYGNGTQLFYDHLRLSPNNYETYKNGLPEGPYFILTGDSVAAKGELTYKKSAINFLPAKKVTYINLTGEKSTDVFENKLFESVFHDPRNRSDFKIIAVSDDSVPEDPRDFFELSIGFSDPAIIPRGNWRVINLKNGKTIKSVDFDDNGNAIKVIAYTEKGEIFWERKYPPCNKRKTLKTNPDGSFLGEFCELSK